MRPSRFAAVLIIAASIGFVMGRCTAPGVRPASSERATPASNTEAKSAATVSEVVDGDTVVLAFPTAPNGHEKVRLLAIDTPERGQRWYVESRAVLTELLKGRTVHLEFEGNQQPQRDKYGRLLAYLLVEDRNVNVEMVRQGWSPYVSKYGGERYHRSLADAEEEARAAHRGIWSSRP